ncbi:MAG TPA: T9SS type A sorting domain-containing protein [Candidatus Kapabacteria bacterium]
MKNSLLVNMLAFLAAFLIGMGAPRAQTNSYYAFQSPEIIPAVTGIGKNILTMDCCAAGVQSPTVTFGNQGGNYWTVFGDNDIESPNNDEDIDGYFYFDYKSFLQFYDFLIDNIEFFDLSGNYWGGHDIRTLSQCSHASAYLHLFLSAPDFSCTPGGFGIKGRKDLPASIEHADSTDTLSCAQLHHFGENLSAPPTYEYDSAALFLKEYVEHCYSSGIDVTVFGQILTDVYNTGNPGPPAGDTLPNLLQWFFKVMYYDTATSTQPPGTKAYYCNDAMAAAGCLADMYRFDSTYHKPLYGASAEAEIENYLIQSGKCPFYEGILESNLRSLYQSWYLNWKDTVKDSILTPFDTTLPTLQQIGFEILLGPEYAAVHNRVMPMSILGNITVSPDPFENDAAVSYTLNVPATLTVEVYNTLGQRVTTPVPSIFTNNGKYSLTLIGSALASGSYYVRFSVPEGEVKTIKVSKE